MIKPRIIAFYLPQFHPIPENDEWWGKGFTEWTNVGKATPLYKNHYQPRVPADLGYYDLRVPEVREQQAELAREAGVEGFCYWHYWFGNGKRLLEKPFDEVLYSGKPDFPFCLAWANHSWYAKTWDKNGNNKLLIKQEYNDYVDHFNYVLKAFNDSRYLKIDNKPIFVIFDALALPDDFIPCWNKIAKDNGLDGICFIARINNGSDYQKLLKKGFSLFILEPLASLSQKGGFISSRWRKFVNKLNRFPINSYSYKNVLKELVNENYNELPLFLPMLIPQWDHSPRSGKKGLILRNSTPNLFREHIKLIFNIIKKKKVNEPIVFLKSWNEWAEGNYIEPDLLWGKQYINVLRDEMNNY